MRAMTSIRAIKTKTHAYDEPNRTETEHDDATCFKQINLAITTDRPPSVRLTLTLFVELPGNTCVEDLNDYQSVLKTRKLEPLNLQLEWQMNDNVCEVDNERQ